jgi:hypothetical protein
MIMEFLAVIVAGFGGGGTALILHRLSGRRLPDWMVPGGVAAAMLSMVIWLEYTWAGRFEAGLPDDVVVVSRNEVRNWYRPWTFVVPLSNRIIAVDNRIRTRNTINPDLVMTGVVLQERWALSMAFQSVFDCANARRTDLTEGLRVDADGTPIAAEWFALSPQDPFLRIACEGGVDGGGEGDGGELQQG